jgi:hypothetical protein
MLESHGIHVLEISPHRNTKGYSGHSEAFIGQEVDQERGRRFPFGRGVRCEDDLFYVLFFDTIQEFANLEILGSNTVEGR